jgi:hypothetical protein
MIEVREIWRYIEQHGLIGIQEPFHVCLVCYQVAVANGDEATAESILQTAYQQLQEQASKLESAKFRDSYLQKVVAHEQIVTTWQKTFADRTHG